MGNKHHWVDVAKGIGIFLVVYGHMARGVYRADLGFNEEFFVFFDRLIYSFHMPLFFVLSGIFFLSSVDKRTTKNYIITKVDTLIYPFIIWSVIQGSIQVLLSSQTNSSIGFNDVFSMFWRPQQQMWYLYCLFSISVFFLLLHKCKLLNFKYIILIFIVLNVSQLYDLRILMYITKYGVYFLLGICIQQYNLFDKITSMPLKFIGVLIITFIISFSASFRESNVLLSLYLSVVGSSLVILIANKIKGPPSKFLAYVGRYSLNIYLMHILCGTGVRIILDKLFHIDNAYFIFSMAVLAGVLLPILITKILIIFNVNFLFTRPKFIKENSHNV